MMKGMPSCYDPPGVTTWLSAHFGFDGLAAVHAVPEMGMVSNRLTLTCVCVYVSECVCVCVAPFVTVPASGRR